jgi:hypothetical protein
MKQNYAYLKAGIISFTLLFGLEYLLIIITGDYDLCFWHNTIIGNVLAWSFRVISFFMITSIVSSFFQPVFKTLAQRMLEKQEQKPKQKVINEPELTLDSYLLKQAR